MYEGAPNWPEPDRFWAIIERHKVNIFYTAPTAIRAFMQVGRALAQEARPHQPAPARHRRRADQPRSLDVVPRGHRQRALPDRRHLVADRNRHDHDHAPARRDRRPSPARQRGRSPASSPTWSRAKGNPFLPDRAAILVIKKPWPAMLRTIYGDPDRYVASTGRDIPGVYFTGDGARKDEDGYFWVMGRVDDVINVAGHRLGTMEVESALVAHPKVAEAAVVGRPDEMKGQAISAFVTPRDTATSRRPELKEELRAVGREGNRRARQARRHPLHRRAPQNPQRQDHAPPAARTRHQRRSQRRHDDARRPQRHRQAARGRRIITPERAKEARSGDPE